MDPLTEILDAPRARGAFLLRVTMEAPWSVRIQDRAPLAVVAMLSGTACYRPDNGAPVELQGGDVLVIASPEPYLFGDRPERHPQVTMSGSRRWSGCWPRR